MGIKYESCPYCFSKKIEIDKSGPRIVVRCKGECGNIIDSYPKES